MLPKLAAAVQASLETTHERRSQWLVAPSRQPSAAVGLLYPQMSPQRTLCETSGALGPIAFKPSNRVQHVVFAHNLVERGAVAHGVLAVQEGQDAAWGERGQHARPDLRHENETSVVDSSGDGVLIDDKSNVWVR